MTPASDPLSLATNRPDDLHRVRDVLDRADYDYTSVFERIATRRAKELSLSPRDRPRLLRLTRDADPQAVLIRLFLIGAPVPLEDFRRTVTPMDPDDWASLGLVDIVGDAVRRRLLVRPFGPFILAHDPQANDATPRPDIVPGVSSTTMACASMLVRPRAGRALDLGTGSGYLALLYAGHCREVLATDVNPRAVALARLNAILNRIDHIKAAQGSLFEPAGGQRFDLIGSNPPFVVSPAEGPMYRDSGLHGDAITEQIVRNAPAHLNEGGFAQVICNWARIAGENWLDRLSGWLEDSGCDVWIVHSYSEDPGDYAQHWVAHPGAASPDAIADEFDRWMDYYQRNRIEAIDAGIISLRRRSGGPNWVRIDQESDPALYPGEAILRGFAAHDLIEQIQDDANLLAMRLRCRPEVTVSQRLEPTETGWTVAGARCTLGGGLAFEGGVNPLVFHLLTLCRGQRPPRRRPERGGRAPRPDPGRGPPRGARRRAPTHAARIPLAGRPAAHSLGVRGPRRREPERVFLRGEDHRQNPERDDPGSNAIPRKLSDPWTEGLGCRSRQCCGRPIDSRPSWGPALAY